MNSYTRIFHELMEPLLRLRLNGTQIRILLWVARQSYGRQGARFTAYTWSGIARDINAARERVSREGRALLKSGILRPGTAGEIGIDKRMIIRTVECENARYDAKTHPYESVTVGVTKTHCYPIDKKKKVYMGCENASPPIPPRGGAGFLNFWENYPKRVKKAAALKAWLRIKADPMLEAQIMSALAKQIKSAAWTQEGGKFVPHPTSWLNGRRWEDEEEKHGKRNSDLWATPGAVDVPGKAT